MIDPGSVALGGLVGTVFWLFALIYYFPKKFKAAEDKIQATIAAKEAEYDEKVTRILEGKDSRFNTILDEKLPMITDKIKEEIEPMFVEKLPMITEVLLDNLGDPRNDKVQALIMNLTAGAIANIVNDPETPRMIYNSFMQNPDIQASMQGWINGKMNGVVNQLENRMGFTEDDIKELKEFLKIAKPLLERYKGAADGEGGGDLDPLMAMFGQFMGGGGGPGGFPM